MGKYFVRIEKQGYSTWSLLMNCWAGENIGGTTQCHASD
jgi:hypothetical protein